MPSKFKAFIVANSISIHETNANPRKKPLKFHKEKRALNSLLGKKQATYKATGIHSSIKFLISTLRVRKVSTVNIF